MTKIYTKTGDSGETSLFGGERVPKDHLRLEAYGTLDELNSWLGYSIRAVKSKEVKSLLLELQNRLFDAGSDLATPLTYNNPGFTIPRISSENVTMVEAAIDKFDAELPELKNFVLPGGCKSASRLHIARGVCRRGERAIVALMHKEEINRNLLIFVNRISDLLFVLARFENKLSGIGDVNRTK